MSFPVQCHSRSFSVVDSKCPSVLKDFQCNWKDTGWHTRTMKFSFIFLISNFFVTNLQRSNTVLVYFKADPFFIESFGFTFAQTVPAFSNFVSTQSVHLCVFVWNLPWVLIVESLICFSMEYDCHIC